MPAPRRTDQSLFPRWVLVAVPILAVALVLVALVAGSAEEDTPDATSTEQPPRVADEVAATVADDLDDQAAAASAAGDEEATRLAGRLEVLAAIARGRLPAQAPDWEQLDLAPGASLEGAGIGFEAQATGAKSTDRLLGWLVLAEAERARVLDLPELATALEEVVATLTGG